MKVISSWIYVHMSQRPI